MNIESFLEGCRLNDRKAQEMLYRSLSSKMMGVCLRYASSQFEAEEILQIGFIKVFKNINQFAEKGSFEGWIRRIMINTAIEQSRKRIIFQDIDEIEENTVLNSQWFEIDSLEVRDLLKMVQELALGYRLVFNMYVIEGFSHKEIALALDISESASKSQLFRARVRLQEKIKLMEGQVNGIKL
jgi:RNA polymerase sigma factor (sigma-70 family)